MSTQVEQRKRKKLLAAKLAMLYVACTVPKFFRTIQPFYLKEPYHTSNLSGQQFTQELLTGHPERIKNVLGVRQHVFLGLLDELSQVGCASSRNVTLEEQLAIFLWACRTGVSVRQIADRFQRSLATVSKYFIKILQAFSSPEFYNRWVHLPTSADPTPPRIANDTKLYPFFKDVVGCMDGSHLDVKPSEEDRETCRDRKGRVSQNVLACCSFDLLFQYVLAGWEGSASDALIFHNARGTSLPVIPGRYYLADAGFGICDSLLTPYRGVRYHIREWAQGNQTPQNKEELFNLRHAVARNAIERIFGIIKRRFPILERPPEYAMTIQVRIFPALAAIHNYIRIHDANDLDDFPTDIQDPTPNNNLGALAVGVPSAAEKERAQNKRDEIAEEMWEQYQEWRSNMNI